MNGLEYICIRWNFSRSFLAEMLGVSRQAVGQWFRQNTLTNSRTVMLMDFFGIDKDVFGVLTDDNRRYIDSLPVYTHRKNKREFRLHRVDERWYTGSRVNGRAVAELHTGNACRFVVDGEPVPEIEPVYTPLISIDDRLSEASERLKALHEQINRLARCDTSAETKLNFIYQLLTDVGRVLDVVEKTRHMKGRAQAPYAAVYDFLVADTVNALAMALGTLSEAELPGDISEHADICSAYGNKREYVLALRQMINAELARRCGILSEVTHRPVPPLNGM